jgi:hypothetical protein
MKLLKWVALIMALLPLSCATRLKTPSNASTLDDIHSIVFGRAEVLMDGEPLDLKGGSFLRLKEMMIHISPYVSDEAINQNKFLPGKYCFKIKSDHDGCFAFVVPPGKYYFVEFDYLGLLPFAPTVGVRTYMPIEGKVPNPYLMTFDVPPNHAVNLGTIRQEFRTLTDNLLYYKFEYTIEYTNNYGPALKWFMESNGNLKDKISKGITETRPVSFNGHKE